MRLTPLPLRRRDLLAAGGTAMLGVAGLIGGRQARAADLWPTPAQMEGPYYPVQLPEDRDGDLLSNGSRRYTAGRETQLEGRVLDRAGRALTGAVVEIWQCDARGHYHHPDDGDRADPDFQGFGRVAVARDGAFAFRTLKPVAYGTRTPHIHVKVKLGPRELLTTQLYVAGEALNERDRLWRALRDPRDRSALTVAFNAASAQGALRAWFPIVVNG